MTGRNANKTLPLHRFLRGYRKSEIIFEEGSTGNEMYLIHTGSIALIKRQGADKSVTLAVLRAGDFFGEMALVDEVPRSLSAVAVKDTQLIVLDRAKFLFIVQQQPQFALSIMHTLCQRVRDLDRQVSTSGGMP
ncbi:MAG: cyclic nucleotide-binding domain-containing protein [Dehalococcoidales bacterium]|nr:MAG: cyclic nucleotide-binding domain-containing protein [Dehalococcoidales bacterium]